MKTDAACDETVAMFAVQSMEGGLATISRCVISIPGK